MHSCNKKNLEKTVLIKGVSLKLGNNQQEAMLQLVIINRTNLRRKNMKWLKIIIHILLTLYLTLKTKAWEVNILFVQIITNSNAYILIQLPINLVQIVICRIVSTIFIGSNYIRKFYNSHTQKITKCFFILIAIEFASFSLIFLSWTLKTKR